VLASVVLNVGVRLSSAARTAVASPPPVEEGAETPGGGAVDAVLSPVNSLITLLLGQLQLQEIGVDSISEVDDSLQLELTLHENAVSLIDNVVIVRENMLHVARQHGLQLDFQSNHEVHFHLSLVDSDTGQNLLLRNTGSAHVRQSSSFVSQHDMSGQGQSFLEGVLNHLPALLALTRPTDASRPASPSWDMEGSSSEAPLRVTFQGLDYRPCSWSANLYLALSGIVTAGLDGMARSVVLRPPTSGGILINDEVGQGQGGVANMPTSFQESLQALQQDDLLSSTMPKPILDRYILIHCRSESNDNSMSATPV
jgi:glutamine synthetase